MKYDKISLIGVAVCVLLMVFWGPLLGLLGIQRPTPPPPPVETVEPVGTAPATTPSEAAPAPSAEPGASGAAAGSAPPSAPAEVGGLRSQAWPTASTPPVRLQGGEVLSLEVDPAGAGVRYATLPTYARDVTRDPAARQPVTLGRPESPFLALNLQAAGLDLGPAEVLAQTASVLELRRRSPSGLVLTERWEALADAPYQIRYSSQFRNEGTSAVSLRRLAVEAGAMPPSVSARPVASRSVSSTVAVNFIDSSRPKSYAAKQVLKLLRKGTAADLEQRPAKWLAVQSQYFMLALIAGSLDDQEAFTGCQIDVQSVVLPVAPDRNIPQTWCLARGLLPTQTLEPGREVTLAFTGLAMPKDYGLLQQLGGRLETVVGMDSFMFWNPAWMGMLTRWLLRLLIWLHDLFKVSWGYGLAIIVITFAVKLVFWPLTHHHTNSMRRMQALQPQLKELREKYKEEPQKLYRKQAELFKENKVSQLGGCLPMLLQLPVFFALFVTFRGAIELRHASFLWSADLSMPDDVFGLPIRPLAILMGATMFLQQKMTPSTGDPQQQRMMNFMSIFFIFLFYGMPSGLTLYWTVSQILSIVQMLATNALNRRAEQRTAAA